MDRLLLQAAVRRLAWPRPPCEQCSMRWVSVCRPPVPVPVPVLHWDWGESVQTTSASASIPILHWGEGRVCLRIPYVCSGSAGPPVAPRGDGTWAGVKPSQVKSSQKSSVWEASTCIALVVGSSTAEGAGVDCVCGCGFWRVWIALAGVDCFGVCGLLWLERCGSWMLPRPSESPSGPTLLVSQEEPR